MKQLAIATLVGTVILYVFLFLTHAVLSVHESNYKYTPAQDSIMEVLSSTLTEEGLYFVPNVPHGAGRQEREAYMKNQMGKPWAMIQYAEEMTFEPLRMVMGFVYNLISVLILCIALAAASPRLNSFGQRLWFIMLFALFIIFGQTMMDYNWEYVPMHYLKGEIIDVLVGFGLAGIWLAWYYGRLAKQAA